MTSTPTDLSPVGAREQGPGLSALQRLGWGPYFAAQTDAQDMVQTPPVRVTEVHRNACHVLGDGIAQRVPATLGVTVGDWVLLNREAPGASRVLERRSLIKRRAPGHDRQIQPIAANIDTAFVVTSCNADFNIARLERYVALIFDAGVVPVILLTKADLCEDPAPYVADAAGISDQVPVVLLDARGSDPLIMLAQWCQPGRTVAFLGSSGVGKSTLGNALCQNQNIETRAIREADARGRHTTTRRQLHIAPGGCVVLDTPGMRELQLTDSAAGVDEVFADLSALSHGCRFRNCEHVSEPGCAILAAAAAGEVDPVRLARWRKLVLEDRDNSTSMARRKSTDKTGPRPVRHIRKKKS